MDDAVLQLSSFRTMNLQVLTEGYEELQENIKRISDEMYSTLSEMIEKTSIPFNELAEKTSEANKKITSSLDELKSSNDDLVQSNRTAVTQIGRVNKALEGLHKHYSDTGVLDDKVVAAVQQQLLLLQNQLTKEAREEFEKLVVAVETNAGSYSDLKSDLSKYHDKLLKSQERVEVSTSQIEKTLKENSQQNNEETKPLKNEDVPSIFQTYKGETIYVYPGRDGFFWNGNQYSNSSLARVAIATKVDL
jgi:methyl-accepting chemotaxis protein